MTKLAITGIGGFIGMRMADRARKKGWVVSGVDLDPAGVERARSLGADAYVGDVTEAATLTRAFADADVVFHTAAIVAEDGPAALYDRVNNEGTRTVCNAAKEAGVSRLIHLSSIMVYGFDYPPEVTEDGPYYQGSNPYNATKLSSERIALSFNTPDTGFGVIVIRPGDVYGLGSVPWVTRPLQMTIKRQMVLPAMGRGVINHVHVDNLIDGVLLAFEADACGEAFVITDDAATPCKEYFGYLARMVDRRIPVLPTPVLKVMLTTSEAILPKMGITPPAKAAALHFLTRKHKISCDKARRQLGYTPAISLAEGMQRLEAELRASGSI